MNGKIKFKDKKSAEKFFRATDPTEERFKKIEKKLTEIETRINYIMTKFLKETLKKI